MSSLATVTSEVSKIKRSKATEASKKAKEAARRESYLPKTPEERFRLVYPFIFADKKYKAEVVDGKSLYFTVGGRGLGFGTSTSRPMKALPTTTMPMLGMLTGPPKFTSPTRTSMLFRWVKRGTSATKI